MVAISPEHRKGIEAKIRARSKRLADAARKLEKAADRRRRAEVALGRPIDDLTYSRLLLAKSYPEILQVAEDADPHLDLWDSATLRFLHVATRPDAQEQNFIRRLRETRDGPGKLIP